MKCGGAERITVSFAKKLAAHGNDIKFINIGEPEGELIKWIEPHFQINSLNCKRSIYSIFKLRKSIHKEKPDYIFSTHTYVSVLLLIISLFNNNKIVIRIPTMPSNRLYKGLKIRALRVMEILLYNNAYKIIALTNEMNHEIVKTFKIDSEKVLTINNIIDNQFIDEQVISSQNPFNNKNTNFLAVGNITKAKAHDTLINAFKKVSFTDSNAMLHIIGRCDSDYAKKIILYAKSISENIIFYDFSETPFIYMKYCSVFVLSSRMEGFPNVILEAMYLNKPIATTKCVAIINRLISDGVNGYKAEVDNSDSLAEAMIKAAKLKNIENDIFKYLNNDTSNINEIFK